MPCWRIRIAACARLAWPCRPPAGTPCGAIFAELVRMNEGERHAAPKRALAAALGQVDLPRLHARTLRMARERPPASATALNASLFELPLFAMADVLGFAPAHWPALAAWTRDFVACLSPLSSSAQLAGAQEAAAALCNVFILLNEGRRGPAVCWPPCWHTRGQRAGTRRALHTGQSGGAAVADLRRHGGLAGQCRDCLAHAAGLHAQLCAAPQLWPAMLREVSRRDPSIHNTRRYTACSVEINGVTVPQDR
jgi:unspecific monooxygenase